MDTPMLLSPATRAKQPVIPSVRYRLTNALAAFLAAVAAPFVLAWHRLTDITWRDLPALPGHLLHFTLHALMAVWMGSILLAAVGVILCIPIACLGILGMLATKALHAIGLL